MKLLIKGTTSKEHYGTELANLHFSACLSLCSVQNICSSVIQKFDQNPFLHQDLYIYGLS